MKFKKIGKCSKIGIKDFWHEGIKEFVRPLSMVCYPISEEEKARRKALYEKAKADLKQNILVLDEENRP